MTARNTDIAVLELLDVISDELTEAQKKDRERVDPIEREVQATKAFIACLREELTYA